jgi:hypothetical protein
VLNTLRKRTFAHPWAIVRRSALNSSVDTEEENVRPALGDRSLPRQAPKDERSSPSYTHTLARRRTFAQDWAIVRPRKAPSSRDLFRSLPHPHYFPIPHNPSPLRRKHLPYTSSHSTSHDPPPPPQITIPLIHNHHQPPHNTISGHPIPLQSPPFSIFPLSANTSPNLHNPFHNHILLLHFVTGPSRVKVCCCWVVWFVSFCKGLELFGGWFSQVNFKIAHHMFDKRPERAPQCQGPFNPPLKRQAPVPNPPIQLLSSGRSYLRPSSTSTVTSKILKPPNGQSKSLSVAG